MHLLHQIAFAIGLAVIASGAVSAQSAVSTGPIASQIAALPECFLACANKTATSSAIGCTGLADFGCLCSKSGYATAVGTCVNTSSENDCPALAKNTTAQQSASALFTQICTSTTGSSSSSSSSGGMNMTGMSGMNMTGSTTTNRTTTTPTMTGAGANHTNATNTTSGTNAAGHVAGKAPLQDIVATTALVMSVLLAGAATLL